MNSADRIPVIVGIGEITDRPQDPAAALEPLSLMADSLRLANEDGGGSWLARLDSLDIVGFVSWRYDAACVQLAARLGVAPRRMQLGGLGGETPVRMIHDAARRIAAGECEVAAIVGGEAVHARAQAKKAGVALPWTPISVNDKRYEGMIALEPVAEQLGASVPAHIYPFYEIASQAHWRQTPEQARAESGALWARFSEVAADNPYSWSRRPMDAATIVTASAGNRFVAWPYTKSMVANPNVNQGAAVLITSLARARAAGMREDQLVFIWGGAAASEPESYLRRDNYTRSAAQDAVLETALRIAGGELALLNFLELYSCFPCVPKMALRSLGLPADHPATVTGGLSFFGGPLNNYMTHAACAMTRALRNTADGRGLLYGQGGFVNKHHALVLGREAAAPNLLGSIHGVQAEANLHQTTVPTLTSDYAGPASLETYTMLFDRAGEVTHGIVIARTGDNRRLMAKVPRADAESLARLQTWTCSVVGTQGRIAPGDGDSLTWSFN